MIKTASRSLGTNRDEIVAALKDMGWKTAENFPRSLETVNPPALHFGTDKVSQGYLPTYLRLASQIGTAGHVCEVGVDSGGSLQMWQALFPWGRVAGVDNDPAALWPDGTYVVLSSQDDPKLPGRLQEVSPAWDLIVDDASHDGVLTAATFTLLWPLVKPGRWYVIEDWFVGLHGEQGLYGESMLHTAQGFLKMLDTLNSTIEEITYRYGMIVIKKR